MTLQRYMVMKFGLALAALLWPTLALGQAQQKIERNQPDGYAGLDHSGKLQISAFPPGCTTGYHQNWFGDENFQIASGVVRGECLNMHLRTDTLAITDADITQSHVVNFGGTPVPGKKVGFDFPTGGVTYQLRYTIQSGDDLTTIERNLAACIINTDQTPTPNCTVTPGMLAADEAYLDAWGVGHKPRAGYHATTGQLSFDWPIQHDGSQVTTYSESGSGVTVAFAGNGTDFVSDNNPQLTIVRYFGGFNHTSGDQLGAITFNTNKSAASLSADATMVALRTFVYQADPVSPVGEIRIATSTAASLGTSVPIARVTGNGVCFTGPQGGLCGTGGFGNVRFEGNATIEGNLIDSGQAVFNGPGSSPQISVRSPQGSNSGAHIEIRPGDAGEAAFVSYYNASTLEYQTTADSGGRFNIQDMVNSRTAFQIVSGNVLIGKDGGSVTVGSSGSTVQVAPGASFNLAGLVTSCSGQPTGTGWNNSGALGICP